MSGMNYSLLRTSKMGLRKKGNKYFIRLGWENIDCPKACHCISWSNDPPFHKLSSLHPQTKGVSSDFTEQSNVLLALTSGILFLTCDLINIFWINSSITRWGESIEKSICKILYWHAFLQVNVILANKPVLSMPIWQSQTPHGIASLVFPTVKRNDLQTKKVK